jgi:hypothetical protein
MVQTAGAQGWQPYQLHVPIVLKYVSLNLFETAVSVTVCYTDNFTFIVYKLEYLSNNNQKHLDHLLKKRIANAFRIRW